jgi:hypothetical protein
VNTYAIQLLLHFQSERGDDTRFDTFVEDLKLVAARHGIAFDDYQSMQLRGSDFMIQSCASCGHLTVRQQDVDGEDENILPDFWFYVRRGNLAGGRLTCDLCQWAAGEA